MSGAVNGTLSVEAFATAVFPYVEPTDGGYDGGVVGGFLVFTIYGPLANPAFELLANAEFPGTSLQTGTFTLANTNWVSSYFIEENDGGEPLVWGFSSTNSQPQGTLTLTLSSVGSATPSDGGFPELLYASPHGQLAATLPAQTFPFATGTVTVNVTF